MNSARKKVGFTLVELLVVISIISILSVVGLTIYTGVQKGARDAKRKSDLTAISKALEQYRTANNSYPVSCNNAWSTHVNWTAVGCNLTGYINEMPKDPLNIDLGNCGTQADCHIYHYCTDANGSYYVVGVNLEGASTQGAPVNCDLGGPNNFWIPNQQ